MISEQSFPLLLRIPAWQLVFCLFVLMLILIKVGAVIGKKRCDIFVKQENPANSALYSSVFGLLAFLLGFTFSMSGARFDARRQAAITEANAIGTAILRADLYPDSERVVLRMDLKNYLQARIQGITAGADLAKINEAGKQASLYSSRLWKEATAYSKKNNSVIISGQMIPALNAMFDTATADKYSELQRVPQSIVTMLFGLSLISAFFVGYISVSKGKFDWFIGSGFCLLTSLVIFITLDLDRPRSGFIQADTGRKAIISLMVQFGKSKG